MIKVIGVRFKKAGKIYYFDPADFNIKKGDYVIVETARGMEYGAVVSDLKLVAEEEVMQPLKPVIRLATNKDMMQEAENKQREKDALRICAEKIKEHQLEMKLIEAEYAFDNNKLLFYFTADGRIDFRELVKDLAAIFKTRIELRQIGVRDEAKIKGGIGICGRPLCCHTHLADFLPVSIKMAKEQNLSLNPTKISGVCGRLMCCLKHEEETYEDLNKNLPNVGDLVTCPDGLKGEVQSVNILRQLVKVVGERGDSKEVQEHKVEDIKFLKRGAKKVKMELSKEELAALEKLEKEEKAAKAAEKAEKSNRAAKNDKQDSPDRSNRADRSDRPERSDKQVKNDRNQRKPMHKQGNRNQEKPVEKRIDKPVEVQSEKKVEKEPSTQQAEKRNKRPYYKNRKNKKPEGKKPTNES